MRSLSSFSFPPIPGMTQATLTMEHILARWSLATKTLHYTHTLSSLCAIQGLVIFEALTTTCIQHSFLKWNLTKAQIHSVWNYSLHDRSPEVGFCPPREERTPVNFSHKDLSKVGASLHFVRCEYHELLWNLLLFETTLSRWTTHNPISSWLRHNNTVRGSRQVSPLES